MRVLLLIPLVAAQAEEPVLSSHEQESFSIPWWRGAPSDRGGTMTWNVKDGACRRATMDASEVDTLREHVCGTKCKSNADAGCAGFLPEFAADTTAICAAEAECKALCASLETCYGFDISVKDDGSYEERCYLHTDRCKVDVAKNRLVEDPHYAFHYMEEEPRSGTCNLGKGVSVHLAGGDAADKHAVGGLYIAGGDEAGHTKYYKSIGYGAYQSTAEGQGRDARIVWHHSGCGWTIETALGQHQRRLTGAGRDDAAAANALLGLRGTAFDADICAVASWKDYCTHPVFAAACGATCGSPGKDDLRKSVAYAQEVGRETDGFKCNCEQPERVLCPQTCKGPKEFSAKQVQEFRQSLQLALRAAGPRSAAHLRRLADETEYLEVYTVFHPQLYRVGFTQSCVDFSQRDSRPVLVVALDRSSSMYPAKWFDTVTALTETAEYYHETDYALYTFAPQTSFGSGQEMADACAAHSQEPILATDPPLGSMLDVQSASGVAGEFRPLYNTLPQVGPYAESNAGCANTGGDAEDSYGDGCGIYHVDWCGGYDDEDFTSSAMCCICGGGTADAGSGAVLLITDGRDECGTDLAVATDEAHRLKVMGISTYVVGLGEDIDKDALDAIAKSGGTGDAAFVSSMDELLLQFAFVVERVQGVPKEPDTDHMYDAYHFRQPNYDMSATYRCSTGFQWNEEPDSYCPHNNLAVADLAPGAQIEACAAKCNGKQNKPGAAGKPGHCGGNADLVDSSNALCVSLAKCKALCEEEDSCASIDWDDRNGNRCWLNGAHCTQLRAEGGLERDTDLTYYEKEATGLGSSAGLGNEVCTVEIAGGAFAGTYESSYDPTTGTNHLDFLLRKDAAASLQFTSYFTDDGDSSRCSGWTLFKNTNEHVYTVERANCTDLDFGDHIELITKDPIWTATGMNNTNTKVTCAPLADGGSVGAVNCDNSPVLRAICRKSCANDFHAVFNLDTGLHQKYQVPPENDYANRMACTDMDDAAEIISYNETLGYGFPCDGISASYACDSIAGFKNACPMTCYDYVTAVDRTAFHTPPVLIKTRDWRHMDYSAVYRTWVNGSEIGFTAEETKHLYSTDPHLEWLSGHASPACGTDHPDTAQGVLSFLERAEGNFNKGYWFNVDAHSVPVSMEPVCESTPVCPFGTFCVLSPLEFDAELGRFRGHTSKSARVSSFDQHEVDILLGSSDVWDDAKATLDDEKGFGFGKIIATEARAEAIMRVSQYSFGKEVFRASPLHTRVRILEFPRSAHTMVLSISSPDADDLTLNFGYAAFGTPAAPVGFTAWTGDVVRIELFDKHNRPVDAGLLALEVHAPGVSDQFGLKVFGVAQQGAPVDLAGYEDDAAYRTAYYYGCTDWASDCAAVDMIDDCAELEYMTSLDGSSCEVGGKWDPYLPAGPNMGFFYSAADMQAIRENCPVACHVGAAAPVPAADGWQKLVMPAHALRHDLFFTENVNECAPELYPADCEAPADGGQCVDTDGGYECGCQHVPGDPAKSFKPVFAKGKTQCMLAAWAPSPQSILIYPQTALKHSWRVNELSVFQSVDEKTGQCVGTKVGRSAIQNVRASEHFPGHPATTLTDGNSDSYWQSYDLIVNRSKGTGAWIAFDVSSDVRLSCVRIEMSACEGLPGTLAVHKQAGGAAPAVTQAWTTVGHAFREPGQPGWTLTKVYDVDGSSVVDMGVTCGIVGGQYFGELLIEYPRVPSACECAQLCLEHVDEGCVTWKWFDDGERHTCYLQTDTFIGADDSSDKLSGSRASSRGAGMYKTEQGWWRRSFSPNWPGWVTGGTGPLPTSVTVNGAAPPAAMTPREEFTLTLHGVGFPDDSEALERQRIKIVRDEDDCVTGMPPEEVEGVKCTNWFTCAPRPVAADRYSATWAGLALAPSKGVAQYKVCWCSGQCWEPQNWIVAPTAPPLITNPSVYVWSLRVNNEPLKDLDVTRKDSPITVVVTRRPFATRTSVNTWRLKLVRDVYGCDLLGDPKLCNGAEDCGTPTYLSPDEGSWQVAIAQDTAVGEYKLCLSEDDNAEWVQIAAEEALFLRVSGLPEDSAHPRGLFTAQSVSVRSYEDWGVLHEIEVDGYRLAEPASGRMGVSSGSCDETSDPAPSMLAYLDAHAGRSSKDKLVFTGNLTGLSAGQYNLCFCDEQKDTTLDTSVGTNTYKLTEFQRTPADQVAGDFDNAPEILEDLCSTKCSHGCVTPECFCDGYDVAEPDAFCLDGAGCRAACEALGADCDGYSMHRLLNQCVLYHSSSWDPTTSSDRNDDFHTWVKHAGAACHERADFTASDQEELFAKSVASLTVTDRFHLGAEFVVTPGEKTSLEIIGERGDLDPLKDRIMVIECNEQCGLASPSSAVTFEREYPVNEFVDLPSLQERPAVEASTPAAADPRQWSYREVEHAYCPAHNVEVATNTYVAQHQCYSKCYKNAATQPCVGDDCFCDGFIPGHDDHDSTALCLDRESCQSLCNLMDCHSIDMHRDQPRCFINAAIPAGVHACDPVFRRDALVPSHDYDLFVKTLDENSQRRLKALGRSMTSADVRHLLQAPDHGLSWNQVLRFTDVQFKSAGTYRVCACDSSLPGVDCARPADYRVEIGKVHASGLQCLLGQESFVRGECVAQFHGGLRCYQGDAPEVSLGTLGLPSGLDVTAYHTMETLPALAAEPQVVTALTAFCLYGPPERADFGFCDSLA